MALDRSILKPHIVAASMYAAGKSLSEVSYEGQVYKLSSNENPLGPSPKAVQAVQRELTDMHSYPRRTDDLFRSKLSDFYQGKLDPRQFVTGNSGVAILDMIARAFLDVGLECIICTPAFQPYRLFAEKVGAHVVDIPLQGEDFHLNIKGVEEAINKRTRVLFLASPNNPTGSILRKDQLDQLLSIVPDHVIVVLDEVYHHFVDAPTYQRALPYVLAGHNVVAINSFSKAYGLAGLRVGYCYSTEEIATYLSRLQRAFLLNSLSMSGAMAALADKAHLEEAVLHNRKEKQYLYEGLDRLGLPYWKTQANFILVKPPMDTRAFETRMLESGIMVRRTDSFGAAGCVRVSIGTRTANEYYLGALAKILDFSVE